MPRNDAAPSLASPQFPRPTANPYEAAQDDRAAFERKIETAVVALTSLQCQLADHADTT